MIRRRGAAAAGVALLAAVLGGCATVPPPEPIEGETVSGRLALRVAQHEGQSARSLSTQFELTGTAERGRLALSTPLGSQLAQAAWRPGSAELTTPRGTQRYPDLDALAAEMLGEPLPLAALIEWLHGRPWAGAPSQAQDAGFAQLGWSVSLARFGEGWVEAQRARPPAVDVRARLDR